MTERKYPATLNFTIELDALRSIVEKGQLLQFVETYSELAANELKAQLIDQLTKAGVGLASMEKAAAFSVNFVFDEDDFGTVPHHPWPWGKLVPGSILRQTIREIVQNEVLGASGG